MQAQALAHLHATAAAAGQHGVQPSSLLSAQMAALAAQSSDGAMSGGALSVPLGSSPEPNGHNDWSSVPWGLTQALHGVIASDSELRSHVQKLKGVSEELRRAQTHFTTHAVVQTMTAGTAALGKDLGAFKANTITHQSATDLRVHELETVVARLSTELASLKRQVESQADSTRQGFDSTDARISATAREMQDRGLMMSSLSDRLMDEVDVHRSRVEEMSARLKEMERRVFLWEYSSVLTNATAQQQKAAEMIQTALVPSSAGGSGGVVTVVGPKANALSHAASIAARKQQHFVTKDSVQPRPPGTAVFNAVATAQQQAQQAQQHNGHPLAQVIEQHRAEKAGEMDVQTRMDKDLAEAAAASASSAAAAAPESTPASRPTTSSGRDATAPASLVVPSVLSSTANSPVQHARSITHVSSYVSAAPAQLVAAYSTHVPHVAAATAPPSPPPTAGAASAAPSAAPPGSPNSSAYQRYMADYTTRSLQRDLLEIAETYQATIRNEVDGLRSQLLQIRRQHSEDMAKLHAALASSANQLSVHQTEQKRSLSVLELFLRRQVSELVERMALVEKRAGQVDALGATRAAQMELKYSQRNEEVVKELRSLSSQLRSGGGDAGDDSSRKGSGSKALLALERDQRVLSSNFDALLLSTKDRSHALSSEMVRVREASEEGLRALRDQVLGLNQQMKSLFAEAFAGLTLPSGERMLPLLAPATPGIGAGTKEAQAQRFVMSPRKMNVVPRPSPPSASRPGEVRPHTGDAVPNDADPNHGTEDDPPRPRSQDSVQHRAAPGSAGSASVWSNDGGYFQPSALPEEKQPASPSLAGQTARGYGTTGQVRRRRTPVSALSRGHGSSASSTPGAEIRRIAYPESNEPAGRSNSRSPERGVVIENVLSLGRKGLATRPSTTQHQRAVQHANAAQDEQRAAPQQHQQRPRTMEAGLGRSASNRTPNAALASTQPLDQ